MGPEARSKPNVNPRPSDGRDEWPKIALDACVVRLGKGERPTPELTGILDEVDVGSIHIFALPPDRPAGLHYHDFDEYWLFIEGTTVVTLRSGDGSTKQYQVGPGDLIVTPRGIEHGHAPETTTRYIQFSSKMRPGSRRGHLERVHAGART